MAQEWNSDIQGFFEKELSFSDDLIKTAKQAFLQLQKPDGWMYWYKSFTINDRNRREREITAPKYELKKVQQHLMWRFWYRLRPHEAAHGFVKKRSPVTNARVHEGLEDKDLILSIDIKNFFQRIKFREVWGMAFMLLCRRFRKGSKDTYQEIATVIATLSCWKNTLATGSPSSPVISNIVMSKFDSDMTKIVRPSGHRYSRYADDITISGPSPGSFFGFIDKFLRAKRMYIHPKKTKYMRRHRQQNVTGVVVNTGKPTISRKLRRRLRAQLHHKELLLEKVERGTTDPFFALTTVDTPMDQLVGMASWVASVNGTETHQRLLRKARELQVRERWIRTRS